MVKTITYVADAKCDNFTYRKEYEVSPGPVEGWWVLTDDLGAERAIPYRCPSFDWGE